MGTSMHRTLSATLQSNRCLVSTPLFRECPADVGMANIFQNLEELSLLYPRKFTEVVLSTPDSFVPESYRKVSEKSNWNLDSQAE